MWDGQARSSRYQDFSKSGFVTPPGLSEEETARYKETGTALIDGYNQIHAKMSAYLADRLPRPDTMKEDVYRRNIAARAFDVARYLLFLGIPTGVGQVTSIRTLERQIRRLKASEYAELQELAGEIAEACASEPACRWNRNEPAEAVAPTLARHVDTDTHLIESRGRSAAMGGAESSQCPCSQTKSVDLLRPAETPADMVATLLYSVTDWPYRGSLRNGVGVEQRTQGGGDRCGHGIENRRDELLRAFRGGPYVYDIVMDIGAYRDLHRHRRCQQFRQAYGTSLGFETPEAVLEAGAAVQFQTLIGRAFDISKQLPATGRRLPASVRDAGQIPVQNGFCRGRIHLPRAFRSERALQLPPHRLGDEAANATT